MADVTNIKWLYPPNFVGTYDPHIKNGVKRHVVLCINSSDGTGEEDAIKLKRTDLLASSGRVPTRLVVEKIWYQIAGLSVTISYNNDDDEKIAQLYSGEGEIDFRQFGGFISEYDTSADDDGGDIVFTTANETDGDSYNIILTVRLKE